ncbi:hypothetical protein V8G54_015058 [Vigna mungo]|uniref:Uncharacterized protein n=1 Tax=Vigna mungo TaxID=3915 RepID=A0AAQ3NKH6_VIGMU
MKVTTETFEIVAAETVLVPTVLHALHITGEHKQKWWQRSELVDPVPLLDTHPGLELFRVSSLAPLPQINHHHTGVEVARFASLKRRRVARVRPEAMREVIGEVGMAVFGRAQHAGVEVDSPELCHVVDDDEIGIEVDNSPDFRRKQVS